MHISFRIMTTQTVRNVCETTTFKRLNSVHEMYLQNVH